MDTCTCKAPGAVPVVPGVRTLGSGRNLRGRRGRPSHLDPKTPYLPLPTYRSTYYYSMNARAAMAIRDGTFSFYSWFQLGQQHRSLKHSIPLCDDLFLLLLRTKNGSEWRISVIPTFHSFPGGDAMETEIQRGPIHLSNLRSTRTPTDIRPS